MKSEEWIRLKLEYYQNADFLNIFSKIVTDNLREIGMATFGIYPYSNGVDYIKIEVEDNE